MITKEGLIQLGPEVLADALLSLRKRPERVLRRYGDFLLAVLDPSPQKLVSLLRKEISFLKRSSHFVEHDEITELTEQLEFVREHIVLHLAPKDPEEALQLIQSLLNLGTPTLDRILANYDDLVRLFRQVCEDWGQLAAQSCGKGYAWKDSIEDKLLNDKYGIYTDVLFNFKEILTQEDMDSLQKEFEERFRGAQGRYQKEGFLGVLKKIADVQDDADLFRQYCEEMGAPSYTDCLEIAKRMVSHWRSSEALEWLKKAAAQQNVENDVDFFSLTLQALELNGDYEAALQQRKAWVERNLDSAVYGDVLAHIPDEEKEVYRQEILARVFKAEDVQKAVTFLLNSQEFETLSRYIREKEGQLSGQQPEVFRRAAQEIQGEDPLAALVLYRRMVIPVLEASLSKEYDKAIEDLWRCQELAPRVANWEGHPSQEIFMKQLETRYRLKTKFWSKYKSLSLTKKRVAVTEDSFDDDGWRAIA